MGTQRMGAGRANGGEASEAETLLPYADRWSFGSFIIPRGVSSCGEVGVARMNKVLSTIGSGLLARLAVDEFKAWNPRFTAYLIACAVRRLPVEERARYEEEWAASLEEVPGELSKIIYALSLLRAGAQIRLMTDRGAQLAALIQAVVSSAERSCGFLLIALFAPLVVFTVASLLLLATVSKEEVLLPVDGHLGESRLRIILRFPKEGCKLRFTTPMSLSARVPLYLALTTAQLVPQLFQIAKGKLRLREWSFIKMVRETFWH